MKALRISIAVLLVMLVATSAMAASISYSPAQTAITIPAGSEATVQLTVTVTGPETAYYLRFVSLVEGNLPRSWISLTKKSAFIDNNSSASTSLTITVPEGTAPGTYSSYVYSRIGWSHDKASLGSGILLDVVVGSGCAGSPEVEITGFSPEVIWPPNHSMEVVNVTGVIKMPSGCSLYEAGYSIEDEYGIYTREGTFVVSGQGNFSVPLPVEAWRKGQDKDGRHYTITIFAENELGVGVSDVLKAVVPHDKGKRPNAE